MEAVMAMNIITQTINLVAPAVLERIAAALGISTDTAHRAIAAAVPAVLAAFASKAGTQTGARALYDAVSQAEPDALEGLGSTATGARSANIVQSGLGTLSSLLGDGTLKGLTGAIGKQTGLATEASSSLTGLAGQLALGSLAKVAGKSGLDASGLAGLLTSQQANIKAALPAGLGAALSSAGVLGSGFAEQAQSAADRTGRAATAAASQVQATGRSGMNWLMWLIPLIIILGALWYFLGKQATTPVTTTGTETTTPTTTTPPTTTTTTTGTETAPPAVTEITVDGVDVGKQVTTTLDGIKTSLGGITDVATAHAALPKLQEASTALDGVSGMMPKLSAPQKTALAALITAALPAIKDAAGKVLAIAGVSDVAKPAVDGLIAKLEALAKPA